jgi:hypothetical protein
VEVAVSNKLQKLLDILNIFYNNCVNIVYGSRLTGHCTYAEEGCPRYGTGRILHNMELCDET